MSKIFISFNIVSSEDCILVVRDIDNLLGEVYRQFCPAPHSQRNVTVDDLDPVMHRVEIWTTPDGTTLSAIKGSCDIDASISTNETSLDIITFIVDGGQTDPDDPADGETEYVNPDLDGKTFLVFKPGFGALQENVHWQAITGGGFELLNGQQFSNSEEWTVLVINEITTVETTGGSGGGYPNGIVDISEDTDYDQATHKNKLLVAGGSGSVITLTITDMSLITNGTVFGISTHGGTQRYLAVQLPSGKYISVYGTNRNIIWLARGETVQFIKNGDYLYVVQWTGDFHRLGHIVKADGEVPINGIAETGGWYLKTDYPRLFNWYVNELPVGDLGSGTQDITPTAENKTRWIIGSTKFWVPDRRDYFERHTDGTRTSGEKQDEEVGPHFHDVGTNVNPLSYFLRSPIDHLYRSWTVGNNSGLMGKESTDLNKKVSGLAPTDENRPKNITVYSYRII